MRVRLSQDKPEAHGSNALKSHPLLEPKEGMRQAIECLKPS